VTENDVTLSVDGGWRRGRNHDTVDRMSHPSDNDGHAPDRRPNHLLGETSPYLRQHAYNPVDWHPWGEEALAKARRENRPIFLSIGYAACHWCHVMERESFEDASIAAYLNEKFVSIKVDREERPDLDEIYMSAVQLMSGHGGWPLSVWLTPDRRPFFGGTYFPPRDGGGRAGFRTVIERLAEIWRTRRGEVESSAGSITERVASFAEVPAGSGLLSTSLLSGAASTLVRNFDRRHGGFGSAPKFPHSMGIQLLLCHHLRTGDLASLEAAIVTLDRMAAGGIYDHLGGGFHRYSVDAGWLVPHFEKMLYDQALLAVAYLDGYRVTGTTRYLDVVRETLNFVLRDLRSPNGGFYSTLDADSEGEEGVFYTWTPAEIAAVLGPRDGALLAQAYDCTEEGHLHGRSILHPVTDAAALPTRTGRDAGEVPPTRTGLDPDEVRVALVSGRRELLLVRQGRVSPALDDKVLACWNSLAISAFARSGAVMEEPRFLDAAARAARTVIETMWVNDLLLRVYKDGTAKIPGYLDDYAGMAAALVDLYEADFDPHWLMAAERLVKTMRREFADSAGGFFNTAPRHNDLILRVKNAQDGSTPSGNSLAAGALLRLGRLLGRADLEEEGARTLRTFQPLLDRAPGAFHQSLLALDFFQGSRAEVAIVGPRDDLATRKLLRTVRARLCPHFVLAWAVGDGLVPAGAPPWLEGKVLVDGQPAAYVCRDRTCAPPVTEPAVLARTLGAIDGVR
jgi:uncharacterized protein YyaL (SSP411 family)